MIDLAILAIVGTTLATYGAYLIGQHSVEKRTKKVIEELNSEKRHFLYRWNVASCRIAHLEYLATRALDYQDPQGPYRAGLEVFTKYMELIRDVSGESLKEVCKEVKCFNSLQSVEEYLNTWKGKSPNDYPLIIKENMWDGPCWHVIYGTDDQEKECVACGSPERPCKDDVPIYPIKIDPQRLEIIKKDGSTLFRYHDDPHPAPLPKISWDWSELEK